MTGPKAVEATTTERRDAAREYVLRCELVYLRAVLALVDRGRFPAPGDELRQRARTVEAHLADLAGGDQPMARLAARLSLTEEQQAFLWSAVALSGDPRLASHADALGGVLARRGLSAALHADLFGIEADTAQALTTWLNHAGNPLVARGLLVGSDEPTTPASRPFSVPTRVLGHLRGDDTPVDGVGPIPAPSRPLLHDEGQQRVVQQLREVLGALASDLLVVIEAPEGSGRRAAAAHASPQPLVELDASRVPPGGVPSALLALRREAFLSDAIPVIANADAVPADALGMLGRAIDRWDDMVILTAIHPGLALGTVRPTVRVRWPLPEARVRQRLWTTIAAHDGVAPTGDLEMLAQRYRVGPGVMARATVSAATLRGAARPLDADALAAGLRHNIAERMGNLARRVEVTQTWSDLVVADDTRDQINGLVARVRHAPQVLERWGFKDKMPRGTGVAALLSGPPGTGKSMCAGLIARELDLELYQVDLSQVTSKWVGETEKQLARVFDAAEEGHALLLFDEADALFGQRSTEVKGAVDRYANLEVNFLLQRIESFGGITILTTNLDTTIDRALKRRLAAHIVFDAPDEEERTALWDRLTRTQAAPLDGSVAFEDLARAYPNMTGANIRNAALAAAFLAAADGSPQITQNHLHRAARVEYRAMGHVLADRGRGGSL